MVDICENVSELERRNSELALHVAEEGIVLLENNGALPLTGKKIALYGAGARNTAKGGLGSGEVNNRRSISVEEGLKLYGFEITTQPWLDDCDEMQRKATEERDAKIREIAKKYSVLNYWNMMNAINLPVTFTAGREITLKDVEDSDTDTAVYVLTRQAGEGADRQDKEGEFRLWDKEIKDVGFLVKHYAKTVIVINTGSSIDVAPLTELKAGAIVYMGQAGQEGGEALARLLSGQINFSGKTAATWPKKLSDLPCHDSFGNADGNTDIELYKDGIYVGYRFYDTFGVEPQYAFGYGLSYTTFDVKAKAELKGTRVTVRAIVSNTGNREGKEVVQVYLSCPSGKLKREYQQLTAFVKTDTVNAGDTVEVEASFDLKDFAAYDESASGFVLEKGNYVIRVGNSSRNTEAIATLILLGDRVAERCKAINGARNRVREIDAPVAYKGEKAEGEKFYIDEKSFSEKVNVYIPPVEEELPEVAKMSDMELSEICVGDPALMTAGVTDVVGAVGQINRKVSRKYGCVPTVMADGPAGLRLTMKYAVEPNGKVKAGGKLPRDLIVAKKLFAALDRIWSKKSRNARDVYQFCTAWPSATVQAQSFSPAIVEEVGKAVAKEMAKFGVGIWLAPGMNIQRYPLCGRNFEYYSEDPLLTAELASALTRGVQSHPGCAVTIKHYCCNNQEDNRMKSSSEVNERALREIYLKAFLKTVADARPKCVMTGYNKVNGTYVNSSYDLIVNVLRREAGFDGVVMTDWQSVAKGQAVAGEVLNAENDLIMAGDKYQQKELLKAVKSGKTDRKLLAKSASRILRLSLELSRNQTKKA